MPNRIADSDLTAAARIRGAALECFAADGIETTSIRDIAKAAGASPGLVQHHFKTKANLRDAVNAHVAAMLIEAFGSTNDYEAAPDPIKAAGDRITAFVATNSAAMRYLSRAIVEGDPSGRQLFDAFVGIIQTSLERVADRKPLHADLDVRWAAMHLVIFNLATVLFEGAISANLPAPLFDPDQLSRWNTATTELYRRGMFRDA